MSIHLGHALCIDLENFRLVLARAIHLVERLQMNILASQNMSLCEVRQCFGKLVAHMSGCWDREYVVEFFESTLLGLWHKEEDHDQCDYIQSSVHELLV